MLGKYSIDLDRLGALAGALLLGLALVRFLEAPVRSLTTTVLGSPLGIDLSAAVIVLLIIIGMSVTGVESLLRSHPLARQQKLERSYMFWIVPSLLAVSLAGWIDSTDSLGSWIIALLASGVVIPLAFVSEYQAVDPQQRSGTFLQWVQTVMVHLVALIIFSLIYDLQARSLLSGTAVLVVTLLLSARLFWPQANQTSSAFLYGLVAGMLMGQMTWVLNYWPLTALEGGLLLLVLFYVVVGLLQQHLNGQFGRRVVLEYTGVAVVALIMIALGVA